MTLRKDQNCVVYGNGAAICAAEEGVDRGTVNHACNARVQSVAGCQDASVTAALTEGH